MKTNIWLRECVYKRVTPKGKKPGFRSSMLTFATSAFWHGIAVGYYLTFLLGGFIQPAGRLCRSYIRPLVFQPTLALKSNPDSKSRLSAAPEMPLAVRKRIYDVLGVACTILLVNYATAPFMLLSWSRSLEGWRRLGWYGHWMVFLCLLFFYGGGRAWLKNLQARRVQKTWRHEILDDQSGVKTPGPYVIPRVDLALDDLDRSLQKRVG